LHLGAPGYEVGTKHEPTNTVDQLEDRIEQAIAEVIAKLGLKRLPLVPSQHTLHLMAKAAVAVYESAVENSDQRA
jgi:hypothetical protein